MQETIPTVDPASELDAEALRRIFYRRRQTFEPDLCDLARTVHERTADPLLRQDARNVLAKAAVTRGEDDDALALFRVTLEETWGSGTHAERVACVNLAMILARQRRILEAFALSRRACRIAIAFGEPLGICLAHAQLAKMLLELGDPEGFRGAVETAERNRPDIDETLRGWVPHLLAGLHAEAAVQSGDVDGADRLMRAALDAPEVPSEVVHMMRAIYLRRVGRPSEALRVAREGLAADHEDPYYRLRFEVEELHCLDALGDLAALRERASACLARMTREGRGCGSPTWRMRAGEAVGEALARSPGCATQALRAYEIAAVAALERALESKTFFREFPQLERLEPEDLAVLESYAERFEVRHRELTAAMRRLFAEGARFGSVSPPAEDAGLFVAVCAWCNRLRGPENAWISLREFVAPSGAFDVTHAICPACRAGAFPTPTRPRADQSVNAPRM